MEISLHIPDDLAARLGSMGEIERRALEALALEEYRHGRLGRAELRRLLGFESGEAVDRFLRAHEACGFDHALPEQSRETAPDETRRAKARQAAINIIARRKGVTLGGLKIKDLINEGRR